MKFLSILFSPIKSGFEKKVSTKRKTLEQYQQELLVKQGREQFKKLVDKGLRIPIVAV